MTSVGLSGLSNKKLSHSLAPSGSMSMNSGDFVHLLHELYWCIIFLLLPVGCTGKDAYVRNQSPGRKVKCLG